MEGFEMFIKGLPDYVHAIGFVLMAVVVLATAIAKLTPNKTDDEVVGKFAKVLMKVLAFLPKLGLNPQTKKLEEAYEDAKKLKASQEKAAEEKPKE